MDDYKELIEQLRQYNGVVECRVQNPKTGSYCISFDWHNSFNPKRNADEWLADQKKRFPENEYSTTYVVKEVCVLSKQDEACHEAANAIESLLAENERLKHNLTTTEQTMREYQELAAKRMEEIERLKEIEQTNAALELEVVRMRGALETFIAEHEECEDGDGWMAQMCSMEALHVADEVLSTPFTPTALSAMITKASEVMRQRAISAGSAINPIYGAGAAIDAIRALPTDQIKLEELL